MDIYAHDVKIGKPLKWCSVSEKDILLNSIALSKYGKQMLVW